MCVCPDVRVNAEDDWQESISSMQCTICVEVGAEHNDQPMNITPITSNAASNPFPYAWWRGGVLYQIYPRSFMDSNADGIGDLPGITQRLEHVAALGVDAVWISPFFKSPMKDFGYDVSDYCDVDPLFGSLEDCSHLVTRAHELGLKVMIDLVLSHTSDQHSWFVESRSSQVNPKSDWYVWSDPKPDGTPPNNWLSVFGGSAWQWDTRRCQYYLHNFLTSQPDLNFHCPAVQDAALDTARFWLNLGVDGFRLDTANLYFHDARLRDNPARSDPMACAGGDPATNPNNPYAWQVHEFQKNQPENVVFMKRLRRLTDQYPETALVGEIGDGLERMAQYTCGGDTLHMAYNFDLLGAMKTAPQLHGMLVEFLRCMSDGWACWAISNHDVARVFSRWGGEDANADAIARLSAAFQFSLRGTPCIYQGDELGLPEAELAFDEIQDPFGVAMWPQYKGRDGCRTPMPWSDHSPHSGFSAAAVTWLPVPTVHQSRSVNAQSDDPSSMLGYYRRLLAWRQSQPALISGDLDLWPVHDQIIAFVRVGEGQRLLCAFNFSHAPADMGLPADWYQARIQDDSGVGGGSIDNGRLWFEPWGGVFAVI